MFIVLEGLDGSGKQTQTKLLAESLKRLGHEVRTLAFPCYDSASSSLVKMYLNGDFGNATDVNAYTASTFYAVDRFASFKSDWHKDYESNKIILSDRYVTSNILHQGAKLSKTEFKKYKEWLYDLEYNKMGLPVPDVVYFLSVPVEISLNLIQRRQSQNETKIDIHERDKEYLRDVYAKAEYISIECAWENIKCNNEGKLMAAEDISQILLKDVLSRFSSDS